MSKGVSFIRKLYLFLIASLLVGQVVAFEVVIIEDNVNINGVRTSTPDTAASALEIIDDIIAPEEVTAYIPHNGQVAILNIQLFSHEKSMIYLRWSDKKTIYPRFNNDDPIIFSKKGQSRYFSFNAIKESSGYIDIHNANNDLIRRVHYQVRKQPAVRQSLNMQLNRVDENVDRASLYYSLSPRAKNTGDPSWRVGASFSTDLNDTVNEDKNKSLGLNFGYNW